MLRQLDRQQDALARCDQALSLNPNLSDALVLRGNALRDLGRLDEALVSIDRALTIQPARPGGVACPWRRVAAAVVA